MNQTMPVKRREMSVPEQPESADAYGSDRSITVCDSKWKTCHYNSLPKWLQDNDYIHAHHRPPLQSFLLCFGSIFRLHSESGNILSHLFGFVLLLVIGKMLFTKNSYQPIDSLMLMIYFLGTLVCHLLSSVYHTCKCHSPSVGQLFHRLDYCGISMQIICSMIPAFYYGFHHQYIHLFYIYCGIGLVFFTLALVISIRPEFGLPKYRPLRAGVFLSFGLSNLIPGIHWLLIAEPEFLAPFSLVIVQGLLYVIGAVIYAKRVPEKHYPGKCDLWPQSHQIFHVLVTIAAIVHLTSICLMIDLRRVWHINTFVNNFVYRLLFIYFVIDY